jgi:hypothetical protein
MKWLWQIIWGLFVAVVVVLGYIYLMQTYVVHW